MWEQLQRNIHFSISLRIALRYALFSAGASLGVLLGFTLAFLVVISPDYVEAGRELMHDYRQTGYENPYSDLRLTVYDREGRVLFSDGAEANPFVSIVGEQVLLRFSIWDGEWNRFRFIADLSDYWRPYWILAGTLAALELWRIVRMIAKRRKLALSVLRPINEMAEAAAQLSGSNLDLRLNVAGTKNELRDLAAVINDMLDRLESAYESQKAFVSDASHELRTPIAVIQGYGRMLERWGMSDPQVAAEAVGAINSESESMRELLEKLLFLARNDKKTFRLEKEFFNLGELAEELLRETRLIDQEHQLAGGHMAQTAVFADRGTVKQAVRIFIDNARKYTPPGGRIEISCEDLGNLARITVADSGPGMSREEAARAFDRFYRTDAVRGAQIPGHGLGLAIALLIAQSHGGQIAVKTAPGAGSAFRLQLPK